MHKCRKKKMNGRMCTRNISTNCTNLNKANCKGQKKLVNIIKYYSGYSKMSLYTTNYGRIFGKEVGKNISNFGSITLTISENTSI